MGQHVDALSGGETKRQDQLIDLGAALLQAVEEHSGTRVSRTVIGTEAEDPHGASLSGRRLPPETVDCAALPARVIPLDSMTAAQMGDAGSFTVAFVRAFPTTIMETFDVD